jgi:transportin-3
MQLQFIMAAFKHPSKEVVRGATHSFQYFCLDCAELLKGFFGQIHQFFESVIDDLPDNAQADVTEGMAAILAKQPVESLYDNMKLCCDPILQRIIQLGRSADDEKVKFLIAGELFLSTWPHLTIADKMQLITIFIQNVHPFVEADKVHPAVKYCQEILPILAALAEKFRDFTPILERICRCWRYMVLSYRTAAAPMLPDLASKLVAGFSETRQGCFLWATDSIVREFSEHAEGLDPNMVDAVVPFFEQQATTFLRALSEVHGQELPDLIEDFFRLTMDVLLHHTNKALHSALMGDILAAACHSLSLLKLEVLMVTLHFLRDFIVYGTSSPPSSRLNDDRQPATPEDIQASVKRWLVQQGQPLTQRVLTGMMYSFPEDCIPDASGVLLDMLRVLPQETAMWIGQTLVQLPESAIRPREREKLISQLEQ